MHLRAGFYLVVPLVLSVVPVWMSRAREQAASIWTPHALSSDQYEATPTFTPDGREMYFMRADPAFERYRLLWSRCEAGRWSAAEPVPFGAPAGVQEADPAVTPDGRRLYFISARHDPANEDFDIWYVERGRDGRWGDPHRVPEPVSSPASELLPRTDRKGRLYFGSDRSGGFGKSDIYVATFEHDGAWSVHNLGPPVSTAANEYEAEISQDGRTLIAVVDRGDRSHLYKFRLDADRWVEQSGIPAYPDVFQVGPLLSPTADRLLFAQAHHGRSGELFLIDLRAGADQRWPPCSW